MEFTKFHTEWLSTSRRVAVPQQPQAPADHGQTGQSAPEDPGQPDTRPLAVPAKTGAIANNAVLKHGSGKMGFYLRRVDAQAHSTNILQSKFHVPPLCLPAPKSRSRHPAGLASIPCSTPSRSLGTLVQLMAPRRFSKSHPDSHPAYRHAGHPPISHSVPLPSRTMTSFRLETPLRPCAV